MSEVFVGAQAALTVVLMVGTGLFIRSFVDMLRTDVHDDPRKIAVAFPIPSLGTQLKDILAAALLKQYELRLRWPQLLLPGGALIFEQVLGNGVTFLVHRLDFFAGTL